MRSRTTTTVTISSNDLLNVGPVEKISSLPPGVGYLDLPKTPLQAQVMSYKGVLHPGMVMIGNSLKAHRAPNEAIIFLYGATGSGKSSTLNHLFDYKILDTNGKESCTKDVTEYVVTMKSDPCKLHNLQIGFIDVPGWGDTRGTIQNAINLALISKFNQLHTHLSSQIISMYPNIVLIIASAMDKRMHGEESSCANMLQAISNLHIVDKERPNVVFVLTHANSIPKGRYKETKKNLTSEIQILCKMHLGITTPVVLIENDIEGNGLDKEGDWTLLLDKEKQPFNLFKAMISVMKESGDDIGIEAVRIYFSGKCTYLPKPVEKLKVFGKKLVDKQNQVELNDQELNWHKKLMRQCETLVNTEIKIKLEEYVKAHPDIVRFQEMTPLLYYLQQSGFTRQFELETCTLQQIENRLNPFPLNKTDKYILFEVFKVQHMGFKNIVKVICCGYNEGNKCVTETPLFDISTLYCDFNYNIGIYIPKCIDIRPLQETVITCSEVFSGERINEKHGKYSNVRQKCFEFEIQHKIFIMKTNKHLTEVEYSLDFIESIEKLPNSAFNKGQQVSEQFLLFIEKYSHWMVNSAIGGGRITGRITIEDDPTDPITLHQVRTCIDEKIAGIKYFSQPYSHIMNESDIYNKLSLALCQTPLSYEGGDPGYYCPSFNDLTNDKWLTWSQSICNNPIFDPKDFKLSPLYSLVERINSRKSDELQKLYPDNHTLITRDPILNSNLYSINIRNPVLQENRSSTSTIVDLEQASTRVEAANAAFTPSNENECFPGNARVTLKGGESVRMDEVKIGDYVLSIHPSTGKPAFSKVYLWAHRDPHITATFLHITHPHGHLHISANHLILSGEQRRPVPAGQLRVGDTLHYLQSPTATTTATTTISVPVLHIHTCTQVGYYSPFTFNSFLLVDGVATSVFSVPERSVGQVSSLQSIGHKLFLPLRMMDRLGFGTLIEECLDEDTKMHKYCQFLQDSYKLLKPLEIFFKKYHPEQSTVV